MATKKRKINCKNCAPRPAARRVSLHKRLAMGMPLKIKFPGRSK